MYCINWHLALVGNIGLMLKLACKLTLAIFDQFAHLIWDFQEDYTQKITLQAF